MTDALFTDEERARNEIADWFVRVPHPNPITLAEALERIFAGPWVIAAVSAQGTEDSDMNYAVKAVLDLYPPVHTGETQDGDEIDLRVMPRLLADLLAWHSEPEYGMYVDEERWSVTCPEPPSPEQIAAHAARVFEDGEEEHPHDHGDYSDVQ